MECLKPNSETLSTVDGASVRVMGLRQVLGHGSLPEAETPFLTHVKVMLS